jgi:hypothetical protein
MGGGGTPYSSLLSSSTHTRAWWLGTSCAAARRTPQLELLAALPKPLARESPMVTANSSNERRHHSALLWGLSWTTLPQRGMTRAFRATSPWGIRGMKQGIREGEKSGGGGRQKGGALDDRWMKRWTGREKWKQGGTNKIIHLYPISGRDPVG